jgi:hypothetical protein
MCPTKFELIADSSVVKTYRQRLKNRMPNIQQTVAQAHLWLPRRSWKLLHISGPADIGTTHNYFGKMKSPNTHTCTAPIHAHVQTNRHKHKDPVPQKGRDVKTHTSVLTLGAEVSRIFMARLLSWIFSAIVFSLITYTTHQTHPPHTHTTHTHTRADTHTQWMWDTSTGKESEMTQRSGQERYLVLVILLGASYLFTSEFVSSSEFGDEIESLRS